MIELLTVIAIIGILATLLMSVLSTAKKRSRIALCASNLHQIALAFTMYRNENPNRPKSFQDLFDARYLEADEVMICPEDKTPRWGNTVQPPLTEVENPKPYSYVNPLPWDDIAWEKLVRSDPSAGIAACQLHGIGRPDAENPTIFDYEGLILRARRDGAVVRREVYWDFVEVELSTPEFSGGAEDSAAPPDAGFAPTAPPLVRSTGLMYPWQLFTDEEPE